MLRLLISNYGYHNVLPLALQNIVSACQHEQTHSAAAAFHAVSAPQQPDRVDTR